MKIPLRDDHVQAVKRFALQILNTSLAVIIALTFEGLVERKRIRDLVTTATAHMRGELRENRQDIVKAMAEFQRNQRELQEALGFLDALIAALEAKAAGLEAPKVNGHVSVRSIHVLLDSTSRGTAEATGALAHMPYAQVKRFAGAYNYQQVVQNTLNRWHEQTSYAVSMLKADLGQLSLTELREIRTSLSNAQRIMTELSRQAPTMLQFYDQALSDR